MTPNSGPLLQQQRYYETYFPNARKRIRKHGLATRMSSPQGLKMLWRRVLSGKGTLSTTDYNYVSSIKRSYKWHDKLY